MNFWSGKKESMLYVLVVEPGRPPRLAYVAHTLDALKQIVGGELDIMQINDNGAVIVCNSRAKSSGLPPNRKIEGSYIAGTFFISGFDSGNFVSLPPKLRTSYSKRFLKADKFIVIGGKVCCYPEDAIPEIFRLWKNMDTGEIAILTTVNPTAQE